MSWTRDLLAPQSPCTARRGSVGIPLIISSSRSSSSLCLRLNENITGMMERNHSLLLVTTLLSLFVRHALCSPLGIPLLNKRPREASDSQTQQAHSPTLSGQLLLQQWTNPAETLSVLLIIGGDVVQKAIAQMSGIYIWERPKDKLTMTLRDIRKAEEAKKAGVTQKPETSDYLAFSPTPVAFSFGWVAYAYGSLLSVFGDGLLMPEPEIKATLINLKDGAKRECESWVLARLLRDLEIKVDREKNEADVHVYHFEDGAKRPTVDYLWGSFVLCLATQFALAAIPCALRGDWTILLITGAGTALAITSGSLPQWRHEKFMARPTRKGKKETYILTRGNGHGHCFVLMTEGRVALNLQDLAISQPRLVNSLYTTVLTPVFAVLWILLLVTVGGLERDTWYLFGVGVAGMIQNVLVASLRRAPEAHGFPLKEDKLDADLWEEPTTKFRRMKVLRKAEDALPGLGLRLLPVYFDGILTDDEKVEWEEKRQTLSRRREEKEKEVAQPKDGSPHSLGSSKENPGPFSKVLPQHKSATSNDQCVLGAFPPFETSNMLPHNTNAAQAAPIGGHEQPAHVLQSSDVSATAGAQDKHTS